MTQDPGRSGQGDNILNDKFIAQKVEDASAKLKRASAEMGKICFGQEDIIRLTMACMIAGGNVLAEGVPGVGKTNMISNLATVMGLDFKRVQFTNDLMPADIIGVEVLEEDDTGKRKFRFIEGPLFTQFLMADELNRASPKTQSALLEAMQEHKVTSGGVTYKLPRPFQVMGTQNPGYEIGTNPLPAAQRDRFMMRIDYDYPDEEAERTLALSTTGPSEDLVELYNKIARGEDLTQTASGKQKIALEPILGKYDLIAMQELAKHLPVGQEVMNAALKLVRSLRPEKPEAPAFVRDAVELKGGPSPRTPQTFIAAARALALIDGRLAPNVNDVKSIAIPVLQHRIVMKRSRNPDETFRDLISQMTATI